MKYVTYIIFSLMLIPAFAHDVDVPINNTTELRKWCKNETENYFISKEKTPYNWTASYKTKGNMLLVEGKWRVDGERIVVKCRVAKGVERKFAVYELVNEKDL